MRVRLLAIMAALGAVAAAAALVVTFATGDDPRYSAEIRRTSTGPRTSITATRPSCSRDNQWVTERFTEAEINADPHLQTTTLHG